MKNIRYHVFWFLDALKGKKIKKHYDEIKFIYECYNSIEATSMRERYLTNILNYAIDHVPFYKQYKECKDLTDFPVVDKNIIRDNLNRFLSQEYNKKNLRKMSTSGSTGTPFSVYQDKNKVNRNHADFIFGYELAGFYIGDRMYRLRSVNEFSNKSWLESFSKNIITRDTTDLSKEGIKKFLDELKKDKSKKMMGGYASSYTALGQNSNLEDTIDINVQCIITGSESLPDTTRQRLKEMFNCPVYSRYSNMENGLIAQQCDDECGEFHINAGSYFVEILSFDNDIPVKSGEKGRIVITDFFNYAMPLIRYDTGDIGVYGEKSNCKLNTPILKTIEGRRRDFILDTKGSLLSPSTISTTMWKYPDILQFQFIQEDEKKYLIKLNCKDIFLKESLLIQDYKRFLGEDSLIEIEYVSEIPLLKSGKRKYIINNYKI
jgi:phenylacetate-CoA ligase